MARRAILSQNRQSPGNVPDGTGQTRSSDGGHDSRNEADHFINQAHRLDEGTVYVRILGEAGLGASLSLLVEVSDRRVSAPLDAGTLPRALLGPNIIGLPPALRAWMPLREPVHVPLAPPRSRPLTALQRQQLHAAFHRRHLRMSGQEAVALHAIGERFRLPSPEHYPPDRAQHLRRLQGIPSPPRPPPTPPPSHPPGAAPGAHPPPHLNAPLASLLLPHPQLRDPLRPAHPPPALPRLPHVPQLPFAANRRGVPFHGPPHQIPPWSYLLWPGMPFPGPQLGVGQPPRPRPPARSSSADSATEWSPPRQRPRRG